MQIIAPRRPFDVIVVGSGASGGWAAKRLAEAGVKVALVDCGRPLTDASYSEHMRPFELKYRDRAHELIRKTRPVQKDCYACMENNYDWFANDLDEPYTTLDGRPFGWLGRMRVVGGRTNVWGRQSYRLSDLDMQEDDGGDDLTTPECTMHEAECTMHDAQCTRQMQMQMQQCKKMQAAECRMHNELLTV